VLKQYKSTSEEECSKLLHQREEAKSQWMQNSSQIVVIKQRKTWD